MRQRLSRAALERGSSWLWAARTIDQWVVRKCAAAGVLPGDVLAFMTRSDVRKARALCLIQMGGSGEAGAGGEHHG